MYGTHTQFHVSFLPLYLYPSNPLPPPPRNYWCTFCPRPLMSRHPSSTPLYLLQPVFLISAISTYSPPYLILPLHLILYFTSSHKNFSKIILYVFERSTVPCLQDLIHTTVIFLLYFIF